MYLLLISLGLLSSTTAIPLTEKVEKSEAALRNANYVLPGESVPTFYDVQLILDPDNESYFNGTVDIRVFTYFETNELVLQAMELTILDIKVFPVESVEDIFASFSLATDDTHKLRIQLNRVITPLQPHTIQIQYSGLYAENMFGIYLSTYESSEEGPGTRKVITSQLQPTFARRAFPCYDEPDKKAVFRTTIYAPAAYSVVRSNMPLRDDQLKENIPGYLKHEFQDTLVMSSYLIAYLVSNFESIDNSANPLYRAPFAVYSRSGTQSYAEYALDFGQRNMVALEEYTELPYAFPKMDKVAVPDFAAGAMENWGLVVYREVALLVQEGVTTTAIRQNIARIICHENTHMWFGNEVSPLSWTYTWLNEGFANFFEAFATDLVLPNYRMMDQFVVSLQGVMQNDAVLSVNPMTHEVYTPSEIIGTFNSVAYQKSGSVIRMMQHFLTPEVFRQGLVNYIRTNSRRAVSPSDLIAALQQTMIELNYTLPYTLTNILQYWTTQGGFPVLTVRRSAPTAESIYVSQERFLTDRSLSSSDRWHVPINWVLSTDADFSDTRPQAWVPRTITAQSYDIPGLSQAEWFIVNKQQTGYYRVNYDLENWEALARVLSTSHQTIHVLNRAQVVDDAFNLARNGRLSYRYPFEISRYLLLEKDYIPWSSANTALTYLDSVLSGSNIYSVFQDYMLTLTAPLFDELGFTASPTEEHVAAYHRTIMLDMNCRYGNQRCVQQAQELLESYRNDQSQNLNPDIQATVFCSGLRGGDVGNFDFLWDLYITSSDSGQQSILLSALGCTTNEELRDFLLNQVISDDSAVREQDRHSIITSIVNSSPENMESALDFVIEHFAEIQPRVQGLTGTANILAAFSRRLNTQVHSNKIDQFSNRYQDIFSAGELAGIAAIRENIAASLTWRSENYDVVDSWLRENFGADENDANTVSSSVVMIISVVIAVCNLNVE